MACNAHCYRSDISADKVMTCALSHSPPNLPVARFAARLPSGILGLTDFGASLLPIATCEDDPDTVRLALSCSLDPMSRCLGLDGPSTGGDAVDLALACGALRALRVLVGLPRVREARNSALFPRWCTTAIVERNMEMVKILVDAFGRAAFGPPGVEAEFLYGIVVEVLALDRCDNVAILRRLKTLGFKGLGGGEPCPRPGYSAGCPGVLMMEQANIYNAFALRAQPAPENSAFMKLWIEEYDRINRATSGDTAVDRVLWLGTG